MPSAPPFVSGWNVFTRISFAAPPLSLRRVVAYLPIRTDPLPHSSVAATCMASAARNEHFFSAFSAYAMTTGLRLLIVASRTPWPSL